MVTAQRFPDIHAMGGLVDISDRLAACVDDLLHHGIRHLRTGATPVTRAAEVVHDDLRALLGEQQRMLATEPAARARDDGNPPGECTNDYPPRRVLPEREAASYAT
jgi:hypothetical protein